MTTLRLTAGQQELWASKSRGSDGGKLALSLREAARAIGVSERTLWEYVKRGDVPSVRMGRAGKRTAKGRRVLIPVDSLRAWLLAQAGQGEGEQTAPPGTV